MCKNIVPGKCIPFLATQDQSPWSKQAMYYTCSHALSAAYWRNHQLHAYDMH